MAQRAEKEETEFKVPETLTHCVNNCGVTGNPSTNLCQKCFNAATTSSSFSSAAILKFSGEKSPRSTSSFSFEAPAETFRKTTVSEIARSDESLNRRVVNRCSGCRRKETKLQHHLGLMAARYQQLVMQGLAPPQILNNAGIALDVRSTIMEEFWEEVLWRDWDLWKEKVSIPCDQCCY